MVSPSKLPHILIIHADQHRADCLGCAGNMDIQTPHLDALAKDGTLYQNCFSTFPVCTPARYSFLTGLYVHQHLGWTNRSTLPNGLGTFPELCKQQGYKTTAVGKMHFTPTYLDVGFETMLLSEQDGPGRYDDDYHRYLMEKGLIDKTDTQDQVYLYRGGAPPEYKSSFGAIPSNLPEKHYSTTWIGDQAASTIDSWTESDPQLLMVGFIKPHHPFDAPPPWAEMYHPSQLSLLPGWTETLMLLDHKFSGGFFDYSTLTEESMKQVLAQYYASISQIDAQVGRFIDLLKKKGLYDNTLIIYTGDHGDYMGLHHLLLKGNYMYDPVIKVPCIVKTPHPDSEEQGVIEEKLVSIMDLAVTIMDQSGANIPQYLWTQAEPIEDVERDYVFAEDDKLNYMVRSSSRKLLFSKTVASQYFDLDQDPYELVNLYDNPQYAEEIVAMKEVLYDWILFSARSRNNQNHFDRKISGPNVPEYDDDHRERMEAYIDSKMKSTKLTFKI